MKIVFVKTSDDEHTVKVIRCDNSTEEAVLNSRSFLRHDFAHLAIEMEIPLSAGYWGSVAAGAALDGKSLAGREIAIAESLAGPIQTLIRSNSGIGAYQDILDKMQPQLASRNLAKRIHERARQLLGNWRATAYGSEMTIDWPIPESTCQKP